MVHPHTGLRIALCVWLTALDSGLSLEQQDWLRTRLHSRAPFTPQELARLKAPLLVWGVRQGMGERLADYLQDKERTKDGALS